MKIYVKKDKVLKLLGEGKVYSKKDLLLKELNAGVKPVAAAPTNITTTGDFFNTAAQNEHNPALGGTSAQLGQLNNKAEKNNGEGVEFHLPSNPTGAEKEVVRNAANNSALRDATVTVGDEASGVDSNLQTNSVAPRKVMDEMRTNSVPFTKSELTEFLKSL